MVYLPRIIDAEIDSLLGESAAIALEGPKAVGKTATAARRCRSMFALDNPQTRDRVTADPQQVVNAETPVLIDEWQRMPGLWDVVRRAVDDDRTAGQFLLTGSATPLPGTEIHSGAGRILSLRMRPMALCERGITEPTVSIRDLLSGTANIEGQTSFRLGDYVSEIVASGFPAIHGLSPAQQRRELDSYLRLVLDRDVPDQGYELRRPESLRRWLAAYAAASSTTTTYSRIIDAANPGDSQRPARSTTLAYRDLLSQLWLLDPVPGWAPTMNHFARLQLAPKHQLADPALVARLLGLSHARLMGDEPIGNALGQLFESLATLTVRVAGQAAEARIAHLRTGNGDHEIDLILEDFEGRIIAFEVKLAPVVSDRDVRHLHWLQQHLGSRLVDRVMITTGTHAYRRQDGVALVPLALLGA